jgi:hypothetical protein
MPLAIGVVAITALAQSVAFYRPPRRTGLGLSVIFVWLAAGIGLWAGEWLGWLNVFGSLLLLIFLAWFLVKRRSSLRVNRALLPWFTAAVLATIAFLCWISYITLLNSLVVVYSRPGPMQP